MPELSLNIGDRTFTVACQDGEEVHLKTAASFLDAEAKVVNQSVGRVPESRMLLMAGLMLADKMAAVDDQDSYAQEKIDAAETKLRTSEERILELERQLSEAKAAAEALPEPVAAPAPIVAPTPEIDLGRLEEIAVDLEQLATSLENSINA